MKLIIKLGGNMKKFIGFIIILGICLLSGCKCEKQKQILGVWWWDDTLGIDYLEFAKNNEVTEIYYCNSSFDDKTSKFIEKANEYEIKVYWLAGEYQWLDDSKKLYEQISNYEEYQKNFDKNKFSGIHLDIEPHQNPNFDIERIGLITNLIGLANDLKSNYPDITFDYDIPFWFSDIITYKNLEKKAYEHMIDVADRVFLMSYRDSSNSIYDVSKDEIEYASINNKVLILGIETKSNEGDKVSFQEEGKDYMYLQIKELRKKIPSNFGVSIHQIKTWKELKDK